MKANLSALILALCIAVAMILPVMAEVTDSDPVQSQIERIVVSYAANGTKDEEALSALAACFLSARKKNQLCYRVGGDEFIFICRQTSRDEMLQLVNDIRKNVADTKYSCSIGYCHISDGVDSVDALLQRSDEKMYKEKAIYYSYSKRDRRSR